MTLSLAFIEGIGGPELMMIMFVVLLLLSSLSASVSKKHEFQLVR